MTENKAIKELSYDDTAYGGRCTEEVRKTAIQALEKVQAFEAIGTIEEFRALKEASELWVHNNNLAYQQGRNDVIEEFSEKLREMSGSTIDSEWIQNTIKEMK